MNRRQSDAEKATGSQSAVHGLTLQILWVPFQGRTNHGSAHRLVATRVSNRAPSMRYRRILRSDGSSISFFDLEEGVFRRPEVPELCFPVAEERSVEEAVEMIDSSELTESRRGS